MPDITTEGKPTLFFSSNDVDSSWRLNEKMIALLESYLQGREDLYTFSSARIPNVVGDPTEVDAAFSSLDDPTRFFRFVQVRAREGVEGRPWIEQIIGQKRSLGIGAATAVSTGGFSQYAINLASHEDILLRVLQPESAENIRKWYLPDSIGQEKTLIDIVRCSILVETGPTIREFPADQDNTREDNILVPTVEPHRYRAISLIRVFDVDIMQNPERRREFLARVPTGNASHKVTTAIEYKVPQLYLKTSESLSRESVVPIRAIVFFIAANKQRLGAPIAHRYKYLDAVNDAQLAQMMVAEIEVGHQPQYVSLIRYSCDAGMCKLGGAFFR
ncbi:MAG: hypothetical protein JW753_08845 [Dehalococcoidia bacterium]|nr:hypothetical protein [Dehalococcoidia bacterium]